MKRLQLIATACATALLAALTLNVAAQDFNTSERTFLTFSSAVELPGVTLPAGTYLFKLADSPSNRHIVQVFDQDERQLHATILAVPAERMEATGENVVTFRETVAGGTPAVQYWYYPGDRIGHEFVYPKDQAMRIAQRSGQNVLTSEGDLASSESTVTSVGPEGQVTEWEHEGTIAHTHPSQTPESGAVTGTTGVPETPAEPEPAEQPEPMAAQPQPEEPEEPAEPEQPAQPEPATPEDPEAVGTAGAELPATASPLPLAGLIGLISLGGALALRRGRK